QLNYRDTYGQSHSDTYPLNLIVSGRIELVVYSKVVTPKPSSPGGRITLTATILNKGNTKATYMNASILLTSPLELSEESMTYVGDIEENSPVPFSVIAKIISDTQDGTYPILISISYRDDMYKEHKLTFAIDVTITKPQTGQNTSSSSTDLVTFLRETSWTFAILIGAAVVLLLLYKRHLSNRQLVKSTSFSG
ncbi:hypothetical protein MUP77_22280, partial [Candidatus Bathyarchaeota archaeon]|nr:hypothetical protein [Candidatus Bathyarchaeota archaeon]